jgi:hypothetical protein
MLAGVGWLLQHALQLALSRICHMCRGAAAVVAAPKLRARGVQLAPHLDLAAQFM